MPYNTYQYPTVWNGANVLSAGNPEWAEEDAAIHASNLANWRIKLLQARKVQADLSRQVMDSVYGATATGAKAGGKGGKKLQAAVSKLAHGTSKALKSIEKQLDSNKDLASSGSKEVKKILKQMDGLAKEFRADDADLESDGDAAAVTDGV